MSNEMIVENGAVDAAGETKQNPDRTLVGKIARLPKDIREELNHRIDDNQPGSEILPWLNGLPAVKTILDKYFRGVGISDANLSQWKRVGYKRWVERQETMAELAELAEDMEDFSQAGGMKLARGTATLAAARILKLLQGIQPGQGSIDELTKISYAVSALLNAEQNQARLEFEKTRVFQGNERLVLSWDKHLRGCIATAQRALNDQIAKDIQAANVDNSEKIELMGHHMFGKKWQGRKIKKKEAVKKEPAEGVEKTGVQTADQQVRPTMAQGDRTEAAVSPVEEKAEVKKAEGQMADQQVCPTTVQGHSAEPQKTDAQERVPTTISNPKQKPTVREAQVAPVKNAQPKPLEDPLAPKPSPWDSFSEPVRPSPFTSFHGTLRPDSWKNKLG